MKIAPRGIGVSPVAFQSWLGVYVVLAALLVIASPAKSLVVMNLDPSANYEAPTTSTLLGYNDVDPGWANSTTRGVYLGNGWVLTARHTLPSQSSLETINGETYDILPQTRVDLRNPKVVTDAGLSDIADLKIFRVGSLEQFSGTPEQRAAAQGVELQPIAISDGTLASNTGLVIIGNGRIRAPDDSLLHWEKNKSSSTWPIAQECDGCLDYTNANQIAPSGKQHAIGYASTTTTAQAWGTNKVESASSVANAFEDFERLSGTNYYVLDDPDTSSDINTVVQAFDFDEYNFTTDGEGNPTGGGGNEVQAAASDSGSGVYAWDGSKWELAGVMHSIGTYIHPVYSVAIREDQGAANDRAYGDLTIFSDLSVYREQIEAYMAPPEGFEFQGTGEDTRFFHLVGREFGYDSSGDLVVTDPGLWGDVNLDGIVSGDGTGSWEDDDVVAFIAGWGHQQASGDIFSWKRGDLNQDGMTDLTDFLLLRDGINGVTGAELHLATLLGGPDATAVPEPSAVLLSAMGVFSLLAWRLGFRHRLRM